MWFCEALKIAFECEFSVIVNSLTHHYLVYAICFEVRACTIIKAKFLGTKSNLNQALYEFWNPTNRERIQAQLYISKTFFEYVQMTEHM